VVIGDPVGSSDVGAIDGTELGRFELGKSEGDVVGSSNVGTIDGSELGKFEGENIGDMLGEDVKG